MTRAILAIGAGILVGCGGTPSGEFAAACEQGCSEYLELPEHEALCDDHLRDCVDACIEVTSGAPGPCSACLTSDGLDGPFPDEDLCEAAEFDAAACAESCP